MGYNGSMGTNELIFLVTIFTNFVIILSASRNGREYLLATIAANLILISIFGAKLVSIFGFIINTGNVFYAGIFLATHMLIEHYGEKEGYRTIRIGVLVIFLFLLMAQLTFDLTGYFETANVNRAIHDLFRNVPRIGIASIFAFIVAQNVNVRVYGYFKNKTRDKKLWLRDNASNVMGQLVDSILFFSIAFGGTIPNTILMQVMLGGFLAKIIVGAIGTPFLYASRPQN